MNCESCNSRLSMYADGKLGSADARELDDHLTVCRRCREDLREIRVLRGLLGRLVEHEPRQGFWDDTLRNVRLRRRPRGIRWSMRHAYGAAATGVAALLIVLAVRPDHSGPISTPMAAPAPAITIDAASLIWLHVRERGRSPLVDVGKLRVAGGQAEAADMADNGRFDVK